MDKLNILQKTKQNKKRTKESPVEYLQDLSYPWIKKILYHVVKTEGIQMLKYVGSHLAVSGINMHEINALYIII